MLSEDDQEREYVVNFLNDEFGEDVKNLSKARDIALRLEQTVKSVQRKVSVSLTEEESEVVDDASSSSRPTYKLAQLLQSSESAIKESKLLLDREEKIRSEVESHLLKSKVLVQELEPRVREIKELEKCVRYLQWIQVLLSLSDDVNDSMKATKCDQTKAVSHYVSLAELCNRIQATSCLNLRSLANETTIQCHKLLKDRFSKEFNETLKLMKWPFIPSPPPGHIPTPTYDVLSRFETSFSLLLDIQLPESIGSSTIYNNDDGSTWPLLLPFQLLFRPFRLRFVYHFSGNKKTNCLSKPEWYFTQVLSWIRGHVPYLDMFVQPVLNRSGQVQVIAKIELMHYLMELVVMKVASDIEAALNNEFVLAHIINETLIFEREMRSYGYPTGLPSVLSVLTKDNCFSKWLELEKELAMDHMDKMLSTETMWKPLCQDQTDIDDNKVPEFAEKFVTIVMSITDRYRYLLYPGKRLQFLHLQLDLLDDFRVRLLQLLREEAKDTLTSNFCAILNAVYYIANVLKDWSDMPFFLQMQYYKLKLKLMCTNRRLRQSSEGYASNMRHSNSQNLNSPDFSETEDELKAMRTSNHFVESDEASLDNLQDGIDESALETLEGTVFEDIIELLEHMKDEMIKTITDHVLMEVKAKSYNFKHEKWFSLPSLKEYVNPSLSPSACRMFMVLTSTLKSLRDSLALPLFNTTWQIVAEELDELFFEEVILMNQFNEGGSAQLSYDMTRNLFPIFVEYTRHPENHFKKIKESCILLNLNVGSALLLQEALTMSSDQILDEHRSNPTKTLEEIGVYKLTIKDAVNVLKLRTDLNTYR